MLEEIVYRSGRHLGGRSKGSMRSLKRYSGRLGVDREKNSWMHLKYSGYQWTKTAEVIVGSLDFDKGSARSHPNGSLR